MKKEELYRKTEAYLQRFPDSQQAVSALSVQGNFYQLSNLHRIEGDLSCERQFIQMLCERNDTRISQILCMWRGGQLDLPSCHLRQELLRINPENEETDILLQGKYGIIARKLGETT